MLIEIVGQWQALVEATTEGKNSMNMQNIAPCAAVNVVTSLTTSSSSSFLSAVCFRSSVSSPIVLMSSSLDWIFRSSSSVCFSRPSPRWAGSRDAQTQRFHLNNPPFCKRSCLHLAIHRGHTRAYLWHFMVFCLLRDAAAVNHPPLEQHVPPWAANPARIFSPVPNQCPPLLAKSEIKKKRMKWS